ncbi:MAG: hypothetical protein WDN31_14975 [Hyphomicrobium sp.]
MLRAQQGRQARLLARAAAAGGVTGCGLRLTFLVGSLNAGDASILRDRAIVGAEKNGRDGECREKFHAVHYASFGGLAVDGGVLHARGCGAVKTLPAAQGGDIPAQALPIKTPAANTIRPSTTTSNAARRNLVSM